MESFSLTSDYMRKLHHQNKFSPMHEVKSLSCVQLLATPWTIAYQPPPSMGFSQARILEWGVIAFSMMTNLDSILKSRDITLPTKVHLVKAMVFPVVMYGCESWTVKKAENQKIDTFELWCWRRLLRVPWTARRSILKEISPGCSLEGLLLKLKLQYFGHLIRRVDSLEKTLMLGGIGGQEEKGTTEEEIAGWHHQLDGHEFE